MDRSLPLAGVVGALAGAGTYAFLVADWHVALGIAAVYAGAAYFAVAGDGSPTARVVEFDDRGDRVGYAVGVFGASIGPLAFMDYLRPVDRVGLAFLALFVGAVAFLVFAAQTADAT